MCISEPDVIKQHGQVRKAVRWPAMISVLVCYNRHGGGGFVDACTEFRGVSIDMFNQCTDCELYVLETLFVIRRKPEGGNFLERVKIQCDLCVPCHCSIIISVQDHVIRTPDLSLVTGSSPVLACISVTI